MCIRDRLMVNVAKPQRGAIIGPAVRASRKSLPWIPGHSHIQGQEPRPFERRAGLWHLALLGDKPKRGCCRRLPTPGRFEALRCHRQSRRHIGQLFRKRHHDCYRLRADWYAKACRPRLGACNFQSPFCKADRLAKHNDPGPLALSLIHI